MTKEEIIEQQAVIIARQQEIIEELRLEVAELKEKLGKNSSNSRRQQMEQQNRNPAVSANRAERGRVDKKDIKVMD